MSTSRNGWKELVRRTNDVFLAPLTMAPATLCAAVNASLSGAAKLGEWAAGTARDAGLPLAELARDASQRVLERASTAAEESFETVAEAAEKVLGRKTEHSANALLSKTLLEQGLAASALPLTVGWDVLAAAARVKPIREAAKGAWRLASRGLDTLSSDGVIPGRIGHETDADVRFGFIYMTTQGPFEAVLRDMRGIVGGFAALWLGDFAWLAEGAKRYWGSMEYVREKTLHHEVKPEWDFPIGGTLAHEASELLPRYPEKLVTSLESGDPLEVLRASVEHFGQLYTLLTTYPLTAVRVLIDASSFMTEAWLEVGDAQSYALCELAIMESSLSAELKDEALDKLRETAGNATIEFEYYVPLLVALDGQPEDRVCRRDARGQLIDHHSVVPSVFYQRAIDRAQAITGELISLRSFLWLYRDEQVARDKNHQETVRKFGPEAARRIAENPLYPLSDEQVAELTRGGRRPREEVHDVLCRLLRKRGLVYMSDVMRSHLGRGEAAGSGESGQDTRVRRKGSAHASRQGREPAGARGRTARRAGRGSRPAPRHADHP